ncbi:Ribosomal-protein-alanine N-acetyltransferase [Planctomycetales bacterium 10988]|nr:Ribosomal-protein-alanine N-acetyltransferase [Planctomycetales bacterium 10988]
MNDDSHEAMKVHIRWMIRRDMPEVLEIEQESFDFPWNEEDFLRCLQQRNCIGMVAEYEEQVVGFMIYELQKECLHVLNFAVDPACRRHRVGTSMMSKLIGKLSPQRRNHISLEVRETNLPAQLFFRATGFRALRIIRDYYEDSTDDAYLMRYYHVPIKAAKMPVNRIGRRMAG